MNRGSQRMCAGFSFWILLLRWDLIWQGSTWNSPIAARMKEHKSHLLLTTEYLESTGTFKENLILWSYFSVFPSPLPSLNLVPSHLHISTSPLFCPPLTPSIQSKPQSALAWIRELLGIPSVSILYVCLWECVKECTFAGLPDCSLNWASLNRTTFNFCSYKQHQCKCVFVF